MPKRHKQPKRKTQTPTYEGVYTSLDGVVWSPVEPARPTTEKRERRISKEYGERGVTYVVDSSELDEAH